MDPKKFARKTLHALILTIFIGGSFHLVLVFVSAFVRGNHESVNPVNFLGISLVAPELAHSKPVFIITWALLILLFLACLYILIHSQKYIALITSNRVFIDIQGRIEEFRRQNSAD